MNSYEFTISAPRPHGSPFYSAWVPLQQLPFKNPKKPTV